MAEIEKLESVGAQDLYLPSEQATEARRRAHDLPCWVLSDRQLDDIELILNGAFSPLNGFLGEADYRSVLDGMRLANGHIWPVPVMLDVSEAFAGDLTSGTEIALLDKEQVPIALLEVSNIWAADHREEAGKVYGSDDPTHPGVQFLLQRTHPVYLGGRVYGISPPSHYGLREHRLSPGQVRTKFNEKGWQRVVAFPTHALMHYAEVEIAKLAAAEAGASLLIHPAISRADEASQGDFDRFTRLRCLKYILAEFPVGTAMLSALPLAARFAGPREAIWHGIIEKNYGCSHVIVGPNGNDDGNDDGNGGGDGQNEAQELFKKHQAELGISMIAAREMVYVEKRARYLPKDDPDAGQGVANISQPDLKLMLQDDTPVPDWFSPPQVMAELKRALPRRRDSGFVVFFTGLSGAGKSTIANALLVSLMERGGRRITLLDGDIVRENLSSELGFSKEHRDLNILRIGFVASEIAKHGGIAICAPIAPYTATRRKVRDGVEAAGGFLEVYVATTLETCESRDRKGLYAAARAGKIENFTGINDPYEKPENPEVIIHTEELSPNQAADRILQKLAAMGYID